MITFVYNSIIILLFSVLIFIVIEILWLAYCGLRTKYLANRTIPFSQHPEEVTSEILVVGDSFVLGVGAKDPRNSLAGRLGSLYPSSSVVVSSKSGVKTGKILELIHPPKEAELWDTIIFFCGGMDIIHFVSEKKFAQNLTHIFRRAKDHSHQVVYISPGNAGLAPLFHFPLSVLYTYRSRLLHRVAKEIAQEEGVIYVDLFYEKRYNPFAGKSHLYVSDFSHPNDEGYKIWVDIIQQSLTSPSK